jgi:hypothetical protein
MPEDGRGVKWRHAVGMGVYGGVVGMQVTLRCEAWCLCCGGVYICINARQNDGGGGRVRARARVPTPRERVRARVPTLRPCAIPLCAMRARPTTQHAMRDDAQRCAPVPHVTSCVPGRRRPVASSRRTHVEPVESRPVDTSRRVAKRCKTRHSTTIDMASKRKC